MSTDYAAFLAAKAQLAHSGGFEPVDLPAHLGRVGVGCELKPSYYEQALRNLASVDTDLVTEDPVLFDDLASMDDQ